MAVFDEEDVNRVELTTESEGMRHKEIVKCDEPASWDQATFNQEGLQKRFFPYAEFEPTHLDKVLYTS